MVKDKEYKKSKWIKSMLEDEYWSELVESYKQSIAFDFLNEPDFAMRNEKYEIYQGALSFIAHLEGVSTEHLVIDKNEE